MASQKSKKLLSAPMIISKNTHHRTCSCHGSWFLSASHHHTHVSGGREGEKGEEMKGKEKGKGNKRERMSDDFKRHSH